MAEFDTSSAPTTHDLASTLKDTVRDIFGELGLARLEPRIVHYNPEGKIMIIRCRRDSLETLRAALLFLAQIEGSQVNVYSLKTSGTLKKLKAEVNLYAERTRVKQ